MMAGKAQAQAHARKGTSLLPMLDMSLYYSNQAEFVEKVRSAFHSIGFFCLKHDIPQNIVQTQLDLTESFFARPLDEKLKISYEHSPSFRGYMRLGVENTQGKLDYREQIEYAVEYPDPDEYPDEYPCDHLPIHTSTRTRTRTRNGTRKKKTWPPYERLKSTNPWPNPHFQQCTMDYTDHVCRIARCLRISLCLALGLKANALDSIFEQPHSPPHWALKLVSYPPSTENMGVGAHTDTNFLTLVLQDTVGGLQAFSQGEWLDVEASPEYLVCNLGEQAEVWSKGYFLATPHRVFANPHKSRLSVPLFYNPVLSATIRPENHSAVWERPDDYGEKHWRNKNNSMLHTVGDNTFKSLARSHPHVFAKHHPDLAVLDDGRVVRREA